MKPFVILGLSTLFIFGLGGCGNDTADEPMDAEGHYKKSCAGCHGGDLQGASGPAVTGLADKYSEDEIYTIIMEGKGMMPGNLLSKEDAQKVAQWLMKK